MFVGYATNTNNSLSSNVITNIYVIETTAAGL